MICFLDFLLDSSNHPVDLAFECITWSAMSASQPWQEFGKSAPLLPALPRPVLQSEDSARLLPGVRLPQLVFFLFSLQVDTSSGKLNLENVNN